MSMAHAQESFQDATREELIAHILQQDALQTASNKVIGDCLAVQQMFVDLLTELADVIAETEKG